MTAEDELQGFSRVDDTKYIPEGRYLTTLVIGLAKDGQTQLYLHRVWNG